jgi:EAL domain-containing protein (putative c-di-GMP-specific phosphodiesterase class I)
MADFTLLIVQQVLERMTDWQARPAAADGVGQPVGRQPGRPQFYRPPDGAGGSSGVRRRSLVWEVTETSVMRQLSQALTNMGRLRLMGYGLAMDDFGIGYSSMQQFARCPFTELKIDRAFVNGAAQWPNRHMVLKGALDLGQPGRGHGGRRCGDGGRLEAVARPRMRHGAGYCWPSPMPAEIWWGGSGRTGADCVRWQGKNNHNQSWRGF